MRRASGLGLDRVGSAAAPGMGRAVRGSPIRKTSIVPIKSVLDAVVYVATTTAGRIGVRRIGIAAAITTRGTGSADGFRWCANGNRQ